MSGISSEKKVRKGMSEKVRIPKKDVRKSKNSEKECPKK
jgi:hypothetical protein